MLRSVLLLRAARCEDRLHIVSKSGPLKDVKAGGGYYEDKAL